MMNDFICVSNEVKQAIKENKPIVALESTIISHGMPYPKNVETAMAVEDVVRKNGAVPATIAILKGVPKAGLTKEEIDYLGKRGHDVVKVSRRDLAAVYAKKIDGATTVSATMLLANMAGINVFATGGIGGAHRNAQSTFDISADLEELARTPVLVVCAGAKAILDLPLTREYLETKGVPVYGWKTSNMPAFYTQTSGLTVDYRVDSAEEMADIFRASREFGMGGSLLTVPIPSEFAMSETAINEAIELALRQAEKQNIKGKEVTPFLLEKVVELTGGKSLESNIKLVLNNAAVASKVAVAISKK
ncbi:MAG TPA: pseudouridine-5'-phosphate glycosidase [Eubacteriales bacterium]|nr:pseudouridine-5'-phosphate glycosidase [Eubacteriales bacterium]